ncbi:MAG: hypothetical protein WDW19_03070 [Neisseriaceae bacterium]
MNWDRKNQVKPLTYWLFSIFTNYNPSQRTLLNKLFDSTNITRVDEVLCHILLF